MGSGCSPKLSLQEINDFMNVSHSERDDSTKCRRIIGQLLNDNADLHIKIIELESSIRACKDCNDAGEPYTSPTADSAQCLANLFSLVE